MRFLRQTSGDCYILSNVISDNIFPFSLSQNAEDYINGLPDDSKKFYVKTVVEKFIDNDVIGDYSSVFYLCKNQISIDLEPVYYQMECVSKTQFTTEYRSVISISDAEQGELTNGKIMFSLIGNYSVALSYPLSINLTNNSTTVIAPSSSTGIGTIATSTNSQQYFELSSILIDEIEYSQDFNFNFTSVEILQTSSIFQTGTVIYSTDALGGMVRFFVNSESEISNSYLGLTLTCANTAFIPQTHISAQLLLCFADGVTQSLEPKFIYANGESYYWNLVFQLNDVEYSGNIKYFILTIKNILENFQEPYDISFLGFLNRLSAGSTTSLSMPVVPFVFNGDYCYTIFGSKKYLSSITQSQRIKGDKVFCTMYGVMNSDKLPVCRLSVHDFEIYVPEDAFIKTQESYKIARNIIPSDLIYTVDGLKSINFVQMIAPKNVTLLDVDHDEGYYLNGVLIKNPIYVASYKYNLFPPKTKSVNKTKFISINGSKKNLINDTNTVFVVEDIHLVGGKTHVISFQKEAVQTSMFFASTSEVIIQHLKKTRVQDSEFFVNLELKENNNVVFKSNETIVIKKMAVIYAD